jgi:uncharacterized protein (TIGR02300 family)
MLKRAAPTKSPERRTALPKASLGTKRICPNCHQPFYDLQKSPAHCPNCAHNFDPTEVLRTRRGRGNEVIPKAEETKVAKAPAADAEVPEVGDVPEAEDEEADEDVLEDASDLGEDEDDVAEVIENVDEGGEER